jgi:hypothetical protein
MTVEDDRDNSPLEEQIFGVILLVPLFTVSFKIVRLVQCEPDLTKAIDILESDRLYFYYPSRQTDKTVWSNRFSSSEKRTTSVSGDDRSHKEKDPFPSSGHEEIDTSSSQFPSTESRAPISCSTLSP